MAPAVTQLRSLEAYGTVLLLIAIVGAAPILMAGLQVVLMQRLALDSTGGAGYTDDGAIGGSMVLATLASFAFLALAICFGLFINWPVPAFQSSGLLTPAFVLALCAGAVGIILDQVAIGVLKGLGRFQLSTKLELLARVMQIGAAVAAAALVESDAGPAVAVGWASLVASLFRLTAALRGVAWRFPPQPVAVALNLLRTGWTMLFGTLGGYLYMSIDRIVIGSLLGPKALGIYGIGVQVAQFCHMLPAAYFQPVMPAASQCLASGDGKGLRHLMSKAGRRAVGSTSLLALIAAVLAPQFVWQGLGHELSIQEQYMLWLCLAAAAFMGIGAPYYHALLGVGRFATVALLSFSGGLLLVCLMVWASTVGGLVECALARMVAGGFTMLGFVWALRQVLRRELKPDSVALRLSTRERQ